MTTKPDQLATAEPDYSDFAPLSDREITELLCQEPLPPNQIFQLPASEQPTENQPTYIETN